VARLSAMPRVLCIRHESLDTLGVAAAALRSSGLEPVVVDAWRTRGHWPDLSDFDAMAVFGGEMSSIDVEHHPFLGDERSLMRRAVDLGMPTLGICLGAQLLALACDAPVMPAPQRECGFMPVRTVGAGSSDPVLAPFPDGSLTFQWHEDTFELPSDAALLMVGEGSRGYQAYRIGSALGVQFHPEITAPELDDWIVAAGDDLSGVWGREADDLRAEISREIGAHAARGRELFRVWASQAMNAAVTRSA
jgi:GMP synthase (glutamine-hydrolysing)